MQCATQKLKKLLKSYGHIKKPKKNNDFFMTLAWFVAFIFHKIVDLVSTIKWVKII